MSDDSYGDDDDYSNNDSDIEDQESLDGEGLYGEGDYEFQEENYDKAIGFYQECLEWEKKENKYTKSADAYGKIIYCNAKLKNHDKIINTLITQFFEEIKQFNNFLQKNVINSIKDNLENIEDDDKKKAALSVLMGLLKTGDNNMNEVYFKLTQDLGETAARRSDVFELSRVLDEIKASSFYRNLSKEMKDYSEINNYLGINSLEIQLCFLKNDYETLRKIVKTCSKMSMEDIVSAPNKYSTWFYEASGRISLQNYDYVNAENYLKRGFKDAESVSMDKKRDLLKLYCISNILNNSDLSCFADEDARVFATDPNTFAHYANLRKHYDNKDHREFVRCMKFDCMIEKDNFLRNLIPELKRNILQIFVKKIITCYTVLSLDYLENELSQTKQQTRSIILEMINKKQLKGYLDDVNGVFENHGTVLTEQERKELQGNVDDKKIVDDVEIDNKFKESLERMVENIDNLTYNFSKNRR